MTEHQWMIHVIDDLALYARANNLTALELHFDKLRELAVQELGGCEASVVKPKADSSEGREKLWLIKKNRLTLT
jgi:hypothetical protein